MTTEQKPLAKFTGWWHCLICSAVRGSEQELRAHLTMAHEIPLTDAEQATVDAVTESMWNPPFQ